MRLTITAFLVLCAFTPVAPTDAQKCESAMELASAKCALCRLNAESKDTKMPDPAKLAAALGKCSQKLSGAFAKATDKYDAACAATEPSSAFGAYLTQCSDDTTAAAAGAGLPDYVGELASCNADLGTCNGDLAACEALPPARLLKTSQTTAYGAGSDGDLQVGIAQGFVDNGDGTITGTSEGLMWEKKSDDGSIHDKDSFYAWSLSGRLRSERAGCDDVPRDAERRQRVRGPHRLAAAEPDRAREHPQPRDVRSGDVPRIQHQLRREFERQSGL